MGFHKSNLNYKLFWLTYKQDQAEQNLTTMLIIFVFIVEHVFQIIFYLKNIFK
jgi:hypothetical protein